MAETNSLTLQEKDGGIQTVYVRDEDARGRLDALYDRLEAVNAMIGGYEPVEPEQPPYGYTDVNEAVAALDAAWDTDEVWEELGKSANMARENPDAFSDFIGRTLTVTLTNYGDQTLRVSDIAHFDKSDGNGKAAFVLEFVDVVYDSMYSTIMGRYDLMPLSGHVDNMANMLPVETRKLIPIVNVPSAINSENEVMYYERRMMLASEKEVFGSTTHANEGNALKWYVENDTASDRIKKNASNNNATWWTRTAWSDTGMTYVDTVGSAQGVVPTSNKGVSPMFCVDVPLKDVSSSVASLGDAWGTDDVWRVMSEIAEDVRANPAAFAEFIGMELTYEHETYGLSKVRVADICHFDKSDGNGKAAFVIEYKNIPFKRRMGGSNAAGGYAVQELNGFLDGDFYDGMPDYVRDYVSVVDVRYETGASNATESFGSTCQCKVFPPSSTEVFGDNNYGVLGEWLSVYYADDTAAARVKTLASSGSATPWFTRDVQSANNTAYAIVAANGSLGAAQLTSTDTGVSPIFNIG